MTKTDLMKTMKLMKKIAIELMLSYLLIFALCYLALSFSPDFIQFLREIADLSNLTDTNIIYNVTKYTTTLYLVLYMANRSIFHIFTKRQKDITEITHNNFSAGSSAKTLNLKSKKVRRNLKDVI